MPVLTPVLFKRSQGGPPCLACASSIPMAAGAILRPTIRRRTSSVRKTSRQFVRFVEVGYPHLQIVVSAGKAGACAVSCKRSNYCPAPHVEVASTAGAGDCLLGGILAAMARGGPLLNSCSPRKTLAERPLGTALEFGVLLASYKVTSPHTIHPDTSFPALVRFANERGIELAPSLQRAFRSQPKRAVSPTM